MQHCPVEDREVVVPERWKIPPRRLGLGPAPHREWTLTQHSTAELEQLRQSLTNPWRPWASFATSGAEQLPRFLPAAPRLSHQGLGQQLAQKGRTLGQRTVRWSFGTKNLADHLQASCRAA